MGDECIESLRALNITYPIENGVIQHWDDMEEIWKYTFQRKLGIDMDDNGAVSPDGLRIMLTEAPLNPKDNRRKMAEIMFEKFHFAGLQCKPQAMLTLYSRGASTGLSMSTIRQISFNSSSVGTGLNSGALINQMSSGFPLVAASVRIFRSLERTERSLWTLLLRLWCLSSRGLFPVFCPGCWEPLDDKSTGIG